MAIRKPIPQVKPPRIQVTQVKRAVINTKSSVAKAAEAALLNRIQATEYATSAGTRRLIQLLTASRQDLLDRISRLHPALAPTDFTPMHLKATLVQVEATLSELTPRVRGVVDGARQIAAQKAHENSLKFLSQADARFRGLATGIPIEVAKQFDPKAVGRNASVLRRLMSEPRATPVSEGIVERYGAAVVGKFEEQLRVGMVTGKPFNEMREALTAESEWLQSTPMFWAQRIVRTESMGAYARTSLDNADDANKLLGDMVKILCAVFDDRTAWDSYQVHGQIRKLSEPFEYVRKDGTTVAYMTPPNRPNDRETVIYHRVDWEIPEDIRPVSDAEYEARFEEQNKKGVAPPRPRMSTVPLEWFGVGIPAELQSAFDEVSDVESSEE